MCICERDRESKQKKGDEQEDDGYPQSSNKSCVFVTMTVEFYSYRIFGLFTLPPHSSVDELMTCGGMEYLAKL